MSSIKEDQRSDVDFCYNRLRIPSDLKSQICDGINDSSETLPLPSDDSEHDESDSKIQTSSNIPPTTANTNVQNTARSGLSQSFLSSDIATPTPERPNPLERVQTARQHDVDDAAQQGEQSSISQQTSASKQSADGQRPKLLGRPSKMKRLGSAIMKSMSNSKDNKA